MSDLLDPSRRARDTLDSDQSRPLTASGHLRRRQLVSRLIEASHTVSALLAVAVLTIVVYSVASRGASALSIDFLTKGPPVLPDTPGGGIAPEIIGTALLMVMATLIAMPVGILIALYLTEFAGPRLARVIRLALDLMNGLPTIVVGLFVFGLLVVGHYQSGFAGALALAIIMLPLIARATQEVLLRVPSDLREAADALGVSRWRTVRGVILPTARGGIMTATVLALARASGETAPLIFTCSIFSNTVSLHIFGQAVPNIPVYIFNASEAADPYGFARAWGAGLVLLLFILVASLGARMLLTDRRSASGGSGLA
ncbi:MAG TPA: phosphate ABC transporter permease PstA [Solirubrobacteraceae bacterium]|jgi:phosphate transport system permease protein